MTGMKSRSLATEVKVRASKMCYNDISKTIDALLDEIMKYPDDANLKAEAAEFARIALDRSVHRAE